MISYKIKDAGNRWIRSEPIGHLIYTQEVNIASPRRVDLLVHSHAVGLAIATH